MVNSNITNLNILTIDDDIIQSTIINNILSKYFKNVISAASAIEATKIIETKKIDVIFTDLNMPIVSGINFIKDIRNIDFKIPIIAVSSYTTSDYFLPCVNSNIQGFIEKPVTDEKIQDILKNLNIYCEKFNKHNDENKDKIIKLDDDIFYDKTNSFIINKNNKFYLNNKDRLFLELLLENKNRLVSYRNIDIIVWQKEDSVMTQDALKNVVKRLRKILSKELIKNISGLGYKIIIKNEAN